MRPLRTKILVALLGLCLVAPAVALGAEFLAYGFADYTPGVDQVGAVVEVYGVVADVEGVDEPLPLDFDNYEYTLYLAGWMITDVTDILPTLRSVTLAGGTVSLYADPFGTPADYAARSTFTDGDLFLQADLQDGFMMTLFDPDLDGLYSGSGSGMGDMVGGSRLGELVSGGYDLEDWDIFALSVADPGVIPGIDVPDGFDRMCDIKLVPPAQVATEQATWGQVKQLFR